METKLIFAKVQRALRSIFHGAQSKLSTEDTDFLSTEHTEDTDRWELDGIILGSLRLEILEEIFFKDVADARNEIPMNYNLKTKSLLECALPQGVALG